MDFDMLGSYIQGDSSPETSSEIRNCRQSNCEGEFLHQVLVRSTEFLELMEREYSGNAPNIDTN